MRIATNLVVVGAATSWLRGSASLPADDGCKLSGVARATEIGAIR